MERESVKSRLENSNTSWYCQEKIPKTKTWRGEKRGGETCR
jgi:hypothetical protein